VDGVPLQNTSHKERAPLQSNGTVNGPSPPFDLKPNGPNANTINPECPLNFSNSCSDDNFFAMPGIIADNPQLGKSQPELFSDPSPVPSRIRSATTVAAEDTSKLLLSPHGCQQPYPKRQSSEIPLVSSDQIFEFVMKEIHIILDRCVHQFEQSRLVVVF
jgi:hypothetical protein